MNINKEVNNNEKASSKKCVDYRYHVLFPMNATKTSQNIHRIQYVIVLLL